MVYQEQVFSPNAASTVVVKTADVYLFFTSAQEEKLRVYNPVQLCSFKQLA